MTRIGFLLVCLAVIIGLPLAAQEPPRVLRIFREEIKPGRNAAHEKVEMGYVRAFAKAKYGNYLGMDSVSGPNEAWFFEPYDSAASLEKAIELTDNSPTLKAELAQLDPQDGDLRTGGRVLIATLNQGLSYAGAGQPESMAKNRYVQVQIVRIRPGHNLEFQAARRMLNEAWQKMKVEQRRPVYTVNSGMPAGTIMVLGATPSLKTLDPVPSAMTVPQAMGEADFAKYQKLLADSEISAENLLFRMNPRMSYPPKDFIDADKEFWAPKPKPAAKPAAGQ
jgi:hypothetical protein